MLPCLRKHVGRTKRGVVGFVQELDKQGYRIISTGGTRKVLAEAGLDITPVEEITGNPEILGGRIKTLSYQISAGILFQPHNQNDQIDVEKNSIPNIEIVVSNLYPFEETINAPNVTLNEATEQIDIGGATLIRATAKNYANRLVVVDPEITVLFPKCLKKEMCHR